MLFLLTLAKKDERDNQKSGMEKTNVTKQFTDGEK